MAKNILNPEMIWVLWNYNCDVLSNRFWLNRENKEMYVHAGLGLGLQPPLASRCKFQIILLLFSSVNLQKHPQEHLNTPLSKYCCRHLQKFSERLHLETLV